MRRSKITTLNMVFCGTALMRRGPSVACVHLWPLNGDARAGPKSKRAPAGPLTEGVARLPVGVNPESCLSSSGTLRRPVDVWPNPYVEKDSATEMTEGRVEPGRKGGMTTAMCGCPDQTAVVKRRMGLKWPCLRLRLGVMAVG